MKEKIKHICCYSLITLLTLILPFTMVSAEETEKNINEEVEETESITTVGAIEEPEDKVPTAIVGTTGDNRSYSDETVQVTTTGDNPASVDQGQIIIPIAIGAIVIVAVIVTVVTIKNKKKEGK